MCRITGFWDFNYRGEYPLQQTAEKINDSLAYGGPDDGGIYADERAGFAFGNRRLSILDLSPAGHQPMFDDKKKIAVTFNGEIYNFQEVRTALEKKGYAFLSHSDTEVIIYAYKEWGIECVHRFRGMFAIAIWEMREKKLILIRDRMGVKPLYYYWRDGLFMFASDLRAFLHHPKFKKEVSRTALRSYFKYGYVVAPHAIWAGAHKLPAGSYLEIDEKKDPLVRKYWDLESFYCKGEEKRGIDEKSVFGELEKILSESFKLRMVSDVPVGVFLSGGIDSTIVTALLQKDSAQPLKTFTVGFSEKNFDESGWARKIASYLGTDHTEITCDIREALDIIPQLPEIYSEPFGDSSAVPTSLVSKLSRQNVKVILSGDGGDEFFGGYDKYWKLMPRLRQAARWAPLIKTASTMTRGFDGGERLDKFHKLARAITGETPLNAFSTVASCFSDSEMDDLIAKDFRTERADLDFTTTQGNSAGLDDASLWMLADGKYYLPDDILAKVDRASMHVALETREPLLDHKILEYAASLPVDLKIRGKTSKYILKEILSRHLPREYFERPKQGFSIPQREWLLNDLKGLVDKYLSEREVKRFGLLNPRAVTRLKENFYAKQNVNAFKIWYLFVFQLWAEKWL